MIIFTPRTNRRRDHSCRSADAFSLVEVIVASSLSAIVLAGIVGAFLMIGRTSLAAVQYSEMEQQTNRALQSFGADVRKATDVRWTSHHSITLSVATAGNATTSVTYAYEPTPGREHGALYRIEDIAGTGATRQVLVQYVAPDFTFNRFKLEQPGVSDNTARSDLETKQLRIALRAIQPTPVGSPASQAAISAQFVLRNKHVSN